MPAQKTKARAPKLSISSLDVRISYGLTFVHSCVFQLATNSEFSRHRRLAAKFAEETNSAHAARVFGLTPGSLKYWRRKNQNPNFRHGGVRR